MERETVKGVSSSITLMLATNANAVQTTPSASSHIQSELERNVEHIGSKLSLKGQAKR